MRWIAVVISLTVSPLMWAQGGAANRAASVPQTNRAANAGGINRLFEIVAPGNHGPQTERQRFIAYLMRTVGPVPIFVEAASAGYDQGLDRPFEWHLGGAGYGQRFANDMAYNGLRQTLTYGMSMLTDEDTRYFPSDRQGFWPRTEHALASTLMARHRRDGREVFSISAATGVVGASLISRTWLPPSWRHGKNVGESIGLTLAGMAAFNVAREFLPDLLHRHQP